MGFDPTKAFFRDFDVMLVKAVLEWQGPAGFDDLVDIAVGTVRARHDESSTCATPRRSGSGPVCVGTVTYVSVKPGTHGSAPIPDEVRDRLRSA